MEYSKNFEFALPSSANDVDLADINEIANNFRKIDENAVKKEEGKGLSTNDFTDEEKEKVEVALSSGVKHITEYVEPHQLEDGIYIVDNDNGGEVFFNNDTIYQAIGTQNIYYGMVLVTTDTIAEAKQITVFAKDENNFTPQIFITYVDGDGNYIDGTTRIFVGKDYVDEQIATLQAQIDELKNNNEPTLRTEIELNNKGDIVFSWYRDATTGGNYTKINDGWSIVGCSNAASGGVLYTYFALVGKTQQSVAMSGSGIESGSLNYNNETYYYSVKQIATQFVTDYGKAVKLEETYTNKNTLATHLLDYYYGVE